MPGTSLRSDSSEDCKNRALLADYLRPWPDRVDVDRFSLSREKGGSQTDIRPESLVTLK